MRQFKNIILLIVWTVAAVAIVHTIILVSKPVELMHYTTAGLLVCATSLFIPTIIILVVEQKVIQWNIVDIVLVCLVILYCISASVNNQRISIFWMQEFFPYAIMYISFKVLFGIKKRLVSWFVFIIFCIWGIYESALGLGQIFGSVPSGHESFVLTGSFTNPGPYGGFIAFLMTVLVGYLIEYGKCVNVICRPVIDGMRTIGLKRLTSSRYAAWCIFRLLPIILAAIAVILCIVVFPASMSRAGWLAFACGLMLYLIRETGIIKSVLSHKAISAIMLITILSAVATIFMMKKDSAIGRFHIWNMEAKAIIETPFIGTGPGAVLGQYAKTQENYFKENECSQKTVNVAGAPSYAFNEYLKIGMETGIAGTLLALCVVVLAIIQLLRSNGIFGYGLVAIAVFAFFSYPLSVAQFSICIVAMLALSSCHDSEVLKLQKKKNTYVLCNSLLTIFVIGLVLFGITDLYKVYKSREKASDDWRMARQWTLMKKYDCAAEELETLYPYLFWSYQYLYEYGYALHRAGMYEKSNVIFTEGTLISADPMFHNMIGKNYMEMGSYDYAEKELIKSHYTVPCRLYPLVLLMEMYMDINLTEKAKEVGDKVLNMKINKKNGTMIELRRRAEECLKILKHDVNEINGISNGDEYELFYCDGNWKSAGTLYILNNLTRGKDIRVFSCDEGVQEWDRPKRKENLP